MWLMDRSLQNFDLNTTILFIYEQNAKKKRTSDLYIIYLTAYLKETCLDLDTVFGRT